MSEVFWLKRVQQKHAPTLAQSPVQWGVITDAQVPFEPYDVNFPAALLHGFATARLGLCSEECHSHSFP
jgi:hypothetical protein